MINGNNNEAARENKGAIHVVSRRDFILLLGAAMGSAALAGCSGGSSSKDDASSAGDAKQEEPVTVVDFDGKEVAVPADVSRIGALLGNSFPQIFFLGGAPKVAVRMDMKDTEWVKVVCPEFDGYGIKSIENPRDPNVEDLIAEEVDLVFYWGGLDDQVKRMNDVGIPVVVSNPSVTDFKTTAEWRDLIEEEMMLYADVLGAESEDKAQEWHDYVDEKIAYIEAKTKNLTGADRKRVYFMRNQEDGLQCFASSSYPKVLVQLAGGELVSGDVDTKGSGFTTVTMEDIIGWDLEIVFTGWTGKTDVILDNEQWAPTSAVKNKQVFLTPCSLNSTFWDYCSESPLEMLYLAKTIHPELFGDLDVVREVQEFYKKFYDTNITEKQAQNMLERKGPNDESASSLKL